MNADPIIQLERLGHRYGETRALHEVDLESIELRGAGPPELPAALAQVDRLQGTIDTLLAVARDAPRSTSVTPLRGEATAVERDTENGATWEVEVTKTDGKSVDVRLDQDLKLVVVEANGE